MRAWAQDSFEGSGFPGMTYVALDGETTSVGGFGEDASGTPLTVIKLTTFDLDEYVVTALQRGASGFLLKASDPRELAYAVHAVHAGGVYLAPRITKRLVDTGLLGAATARRARARELVARLTEREREVLAALADGLSNQQIGRRLALAEGTVKVHVSAILAKLEVDNRVSAALLAVESGVLPTRGGLSTDIGP
ncbi:hypothetical protein GCM10027298_20110 [Epidermidibacterium keratini]